MGGGEKDHDVGGGVVKGGSKYCAGALAEPAKE